MEKKYVHKKIHEKKYLDAGQNVIHDDAFLCGFVKVLTEVLEFAGRRGSDFGLRVLKQGLEGGDQVGPGYVGPDRLLQI